MQPALIQAKSNEEGLAEHAERLRKFQRLGNSMMQMGPPRLDNDTTSSLQPQPWIQKKLTIGKPGDKYEQEADRVASQVAQHINAPTFKENSMRESIQREKDLEGVMCARGFQAAIQRKQAIESGEASPDLESAISSARGCGQPLDAGLQQSMGQAMGADFSGVRVHTDAQSDQLNQSIQARAFTTGQDVFFRSGAYKPGNRGGQELIAHELTHVMQQNGKMVQRQSECEEELLQSKFAAGRMPTQLQTTHTPSENRTGMLDALNAEDDASYQCLAGTTGTAAVTQKSSDLSPASQWDFAKYKNGFTSDFNANVPIQAKIVVSKEQITYPDWENAYKGLKQSTSLTLSGKFTDKDDWMIRFVLYAMDQENEKFVNFMNFEAVVLDRITKGCCNATRHRILSGLEINNDFETLYNALTSRQFFGADVGKETTPKEAKNIFKNALQQGYRRFDTASIYTMEGGGSTLEALMAAAKELTISREELTILYKVKPEKGKSIDGQMESSKNALSNLPDILMLHEIDDIEKAKKDLGDLIELVKIGNSKAVGVSNVNAIYLDILYQFSLQKQVPITYVENRFTPYYPDTEVRDYCKKNGIKYLGFGIIGSAQKGVCENDGQGLPSQYLVALMDPRLQKLAEKWGLKNEASNGVGELLYAWSAHKGVAPVAYSSDPGRQAKNYAAKNIRLTRKNLAEIDAIVLKPRNIEEKEWGDSESEVALKSLFASLTHPTAWFLMSEVCDSGGGKLVNAIAMRIIDEFKESKKQKEKLQNFVWNFMRFAADLQAKANPQRKKWFSSMKGLFRAMSEAAQKSPKIFDLSYEWAMRSSEKGGDAQNAIQRVEQVLNGEYVPSHDPLTESGKSNLEEKKKKDELKALSIKEAKFEKVSLTETIENLTIQEVNKQFTPEDESYKIFMWIPDLMKMQINGKSIDGTIVLSRKEKIRYKIYVQSKNPKLYRLEKI
ncbi:aldo/keto reductase [Acaryochloris marina]|uniref:aldo/keto reductase n=1 Tax=Acaryochloris marina TaxID=155978 RepID=UPI000674C6A2|nr:aldo/keto reductase [Acaryochloris marina]